MSTSQNPTKVSTVTNPGSEDIETFAIDNITIDSNSKYWRDHDQRYTNPIPNPPPLSSNNRYIEQNSSKNLSSVTDSKNSLNPSTLTPQIPKNLNSIKEVNQEEDWSHSQVDPNQKFKKLGQFGVNKGWCLPDLKGKLGGSILGDLGKEISVGFGRTGGSWCGGSGVGGGGERIVKSEVLGKL
jgi:hypothetical protein